MKRIILVLFVLFTQYAFAQRTDEYLKNRNDSLIRKKPTLPARTADQFDLVIDNDKVYTGQTPTTVTVGGLVSGTNLSGMSYREILQAIIAPYVPPAFNSFSISGQSTTVEVGTTLSASKTFTWSISVNSGVVSTIDIYDVTASSTLLSNTANDGTQAATITTVQLNSNGATQVWRGVAHDIGTSPSDINSSSFTVTGRFIRFYGPASSIPNNSAGVRALPSSAFHAGATTFTLATGTTQVNFIVALPPSVTLSSVIDTSALNADITGEFSLTTVSVTDAGGTSRTYNVYSMTNAIPYATSHNFSVTTVN